MRHGLLLAVTLLSGCTLVNDPNDHAAEPVPSLDFCGEYAAVLCDGVEGCCRDLPPAYERPRCISAVTLMCNRRFSTWISDPRTGYDPDAAGQALAVGRLRADRCDNSLLEWLVGPDGALDALTGTVAAGGSCGPAESVMDPIDIPRFFSCEDGLVCRLLPEMGEWRCAEAVPRGGECTLFVDCVSGLTCLDSVCQDRQATDASCEDGQECESFLCVQRSNPDMSCEGSSDCFCLPTLERGALYCALAQGEL